MCLCDAGQDYLGSFSTAAEREREYKAHRRKQKNDDEFVKWHGHSHMHENSRPMKHVDSVVIEPKQLTS
jgi:hypothetical protein